LKEAMPESSPAVPQPQVPIAPIVSFERRVTSGISLEVLTAFHRVPPQGNEAGGILLGDRSGDPILVADFEPVLCDHRLGPSYLLSDEDLEGLEESVEWFRASQSDDLRILGFYRSHIRADSSIDERDNELMRRFFAESGSLFLLLKPVREEVITAELFVWSDGRLHAAGHPMLFPSSTGILASSEECVAPDGDSVGRAPSPADDPLVGLLGQAESRTRGSGADEGVRPTLASASSSEMGQDSILQADFQSAFLTPSALPAGGDVPEPSGSGPGQIETGQKAGDTNEPAADSVASPAEPSADARVPRPLLPPSRPRRVETQEIAGRNWTWVAAVAALTIAAAVLGYRSVGPKNAPTAPVTVPSTPAVPPPTPVSDPIPAAPAPATPIAAEIPLPPAVSPETERGIRNAIAQWERAVRSGDPDLIAGCYASQLDRYFNQQNPSNDEVRRAAVQSVARYGKTAVLRISDLTLTPVSDDRAVASFRKHWQTTGPRIFAREEQERLVFVKSEDAWKIASEEETKVYWTQRPRG
jgi:hypothetical protein